MTTMYGGAVWMATGTGRGIFKMGTLGHWKTQKWGIGFEVGNRNGDGALNGDRDRVGLGNLMKPPSIQTLASKGGAMGWELGRGRPA